MRRRLMIKITLKNSVNKQEVGVTNINIKKRCKGGRWMPGYAWV